MNHSTSRLSLVMVALTVVAVGMRQFPMALYNLSALGALAVVAGARVRPLWLALAFPLAGRLITDGIIQIQTGFGFYGSMGFDYLAYILIALLARRMKPVRFEKSLATGFASACTFFLVSNLGAWLMPINGQYLYTQTISGLLDCFTMAIPFARGTFVGDILLTPVFLAISQFIVAPIGETAPHAAAE